MPGKRRNKPANKRKNVKRSSRRRRPKANQLSGSFAPESLVTQLRWPFNGAAATSATYGESVYRGNGIFDPGVGSSSTQPVAYDQYAIWYSRYRVPSSVLTLKMEIASSSATPTATAVGARVVVYASNSSSAAASYAEACGQPGAVVRDVNYGKPVIIKLKHTTAQVLGFVGQGTDDSSALVTADPVSSWYWHIGTVAGTYTNVDTILTAQIDYTAKFFVRVLQPISTLASAMHKVFLESREEVKRRENLPYKPAFVEYKLNVSAAPPVQTVELKESKEAPSLHTPSVRKYIMVDIEDTAPPIRESSEKKASLKGGR